MVWRDDEKLRTDHHLHVGAVLGSIGLLSVIVGIFAVSETNPTGAWPILVCVGAGLTVAIVRRWLVGLPEAPAGRPARLSLAGEAIVGGGTAAMLFVLGGLAFDWSTETSSNVGAVALLGAVGGLLSSMAADAPIAASHNNESRELPYARALDEYKLRHATLLQADDSVDTLYEDAYVSPALYEGSIIVEPTEGGDSGQRGARVWFESEQSPDELVSSPTRLVERLQIPTRHDSFEATLVLHAPLDRFAPYTYRVEVPRFGRSTDVVLGWGEPTDREMRSTLEIRVLGRIVQILDLSS